MVSTGREGRVGALAGDIALCCVVAQDTLLSQCLSTPRCNNNEGLYSSKNSKHPFEYGYREI